jgi:hypothetical protein
MDSSIETEEQWPTYFQWLAETGEKLAQVFKPLIKGLA